MRHLRPALAGLLLFACTTQRDIGPGAPVALTIEVPGGLPEVVIGTSIPLIAVAQAPNGIPYVDGATQWNTSNAATVSVTQSGIASGIAAGTATIVARLGTAVDSITVTAVTARMIAFSVPSATVTAFANGPAPTPQPVTVSNGGGGTLSGLAVTGVFYPSGPSGWLTAGLSGTTAPATLTLTADNTGLSVGGYGAGVIVSSSLAANSPDTLLVTLAVGVDAPATMAVNGGNAQSAIAGTAVTTPPSVIVRDQYTNPVPNVEVVFTPNPGHGAVTKGTDTTDATGVAAVGGWTLGPTAGPDTLIATASGLPDVVFTATGNPGNAVFLTLVGGDNQTDTVGATLAPLQVKVADSNTNGVAGVTVGWSVPAGQGSITAQSVTDAQGVAQATRILGTTAGPQSAQAAVGGLTGSPVSFTHTANAGAAFSIAANGGTGQTATVGTAVATPPSVIVRDQFSNPKVGVAVTFTTAAGNGTVSGGSQSTGPNGVATVGGWTLSNSRHLDTLSATSSGLAGSPVRITARAAWSLVAHVQPQVFSGCAGCHTGLTPDMSSAASSWAVFLNGNGTATVYVTPGDTTSNGVCNAATQGRLLERLRNAACPMPPSQALVTLNPTLYALVRDWILDGARQN